MFCAACGRNNVDASRFCIGCGARLPLTAPPAQAAASAAPAQYPPQQYYQAPAQQPAAALDPPPQYPAQPPVQPMYAPPPPAQPMYAPPPPAQPMYAPQPPVQPMYEPFPGAPATPVFPGGYPLATLGSRVLAVFLDALLLGAVFAVAGMAVASRMGGINDSGFSLSGLPAALAIGITAVFGFGYYWLLEGTAGATLGKAIAGIRVRGTSGAPCGLGASAIRNLLRILDGFAFYVVGFLTAVFSKSRQRVGDLAAGTVVVQSPAGGALRGVLAVVWMLVVAGGVTGAYLLHGGAPGLAGVTGPFVPLPKNISITATGDLKPGNFNFVESKGGPTRTSPVYKPAESIHTQYDLIGYGRDRNNNPDLQVEMNTHDPGGIIVHEPWKTHFTGPADPGTPVHLTLDVTLPDYAPPGDYQMSIQVHDGVKNSDLSFTPVFHVDAPAVQPPRGLEVRDMYLSQASDGPPEPALVLDGGGVVYMHCLVFGMEFRDNRAAGKIGMKLLGPDGKVLLNNPDYVDLATSTFYHPPTIRIKIDGQVSVPNGFQKGTYSEQYSILDSNANQTLMQEIKFQVK